MHRVFHLYSKKKILGNNSFKISASGRSVNTTVQRLGAVWETIELISWGNIPRTAHIPVIRPVCSLIWPQTSQSGLLRQDSSGYRGYFALGLIDADGWEFALFSDFKGMNLCGFADIKFGKFLVTTEFCFGILGSLKLEDCYCCTGHHKFLMNPHPHPCQSNTLLMCS